MTLAGSALARQPTTNDRGGGGTQRNGDEGVGEVAGEALVEGLAQYVGQKSETDREQDEGAITHRGAPEGSACSRQISALLRIRAGEEDQPVARAGSS